VIRRVYSDLQKFKHLDFKKGLNIVLADKSPNATDKQTRNRAGKSSLVEIIHFLLGARCEKDSLFKRPELINSTFGMELDLDGRFTRIERTGIKPSPLTVAGNFAEWPFKPTQKKSNFVISNENWKATLGKFMFGLSEIQDSHAPSFRSLISYFARRDREGGMQRATVQSSHQQIVDQQVNISFLIGLDWTVPQGWQAIREREKQVEQLKHSMAEGALGPVIGSASSIKSELIVAQDRARKLLESVAAFKVAKDYHDLEIEASKLTQKLSSIADENTLDHRYLSELEKASGEETTPPPNDLEVLYREAGVILPNAIKKRFDDVKVFHESVVRNRRSYLLLEMQNAKQRIAEREEEKIKIDLRRSEVMNILSSTGALEQFTALQAELTRVNAQVESLRQKYETAEALESGTLKLKSERTRLVELLRQDYSEEEKTIEDAILTFSGISSTLYEDESAGSLTITPTENGPEFDPHIPGEKSKGVNNMQMFCFDMTLMLLCLKRGQSPGFLIHDSHLFDGVDERQTGKALALGRDLAEKFNFQYIVTMNTDDIPKDAPTGFSVETYALPVRLTDATEDGGLFGFRFD
jgi:uncharacterized protein YydD (DUF2326 family)